MKDVSDKYTVLAAHSTLLEGNTSDILIGGPDPRLRCVARGYHGNCLLNTLLWLYSFIVNWVQGPLYKNKVKV